MIAKKIFIHVLLGFCLSFYANAHIQTYDEVVSLGDTCQVAWQLELNGIRKFAYPFDWVCTSFKSLVGFIEQKGAHFLEFDKISVMGVYPGNPTRLQVVDLVYGIVFYHDFLASPPLANYNDVKAKYDRRLKRFFDLLNSNKKVLFVREGFMREQIEFLDHLLHSTYPNLKYTILAVSDREDFKESWKLDRISNFYLPQNPWNWQGDSAKWKEILTQFKVKHDLTPRPKEDHW